VDGVGGYLFCLASEVIIGQSSPSSQVAIPILADVSRKHASVVRHGEGYLLTPLDGAVRLKGRLINGPSLLSDGDEFELGKSVRIRFVKPHALSASARLEFVSRHRSLPSADGVILMAESCVLGPKWQNHIVCRDWPGDVVLYRTEDKLFCRSMQPLEINGKICDGRGEIRRGSHISGNDFSMTLEDL
jgi:hypothetical protein